MKLFYSLGVRFYYLAVLIASSWNPKAKKWINGRKDSFQKIKSFNEAHQNSKKKKYWFHCASLGEFEQARPLIEKIKREEDAIILLSFFSPSGYEIRKNYAFADVIFYLPIDSKKNAKRLFDLLKPDAVLFIKYEFWAHYILEAADRKIPFYTVCAVFRSNQIFFKFYGGFMRRVLKTTSAIFVQNKNSADLLRTIQINSIVSGDTRYDRVLANAEKAERIDKIEKFCGQKKIFICGSLWLPDLETIASGLKNLSNDWKIILTTHEIAEGHLKEAEEFFADEKLVRYSQLNDSNADAKFLLVDNIGMLMHLYGYGDIAYVGGAFKTGLHNILEPAAFGLPVIFGPHHQKFPEAQLFIQNGVGFSISNAADFNQKLNELSEKNLRDKIKEFIQKNSGATELIYQNISQLK